MAKFSESIQNKLQAMAVPPTVTELKWSCGIDFIIRTMNAFEAGGKALGKDCDGLMLLQSLGVDHKDICDELLATVFDLEGIVDGATQGEFRQSALDSSDKIKVMIGEAISKGIAVPKTMKSRVPYDFRKEATYSTDDSVSLFHEFLMKTIDITDRAILGEGSKSKTSSRASGLIDQCRPDVAPFLSYNTDMPTWLEGRAMSIRGQYNMSVYQLMNETRNLPVDERTEQRKGVTEFQDSVTTQIKSLKRQEAKMVIAKWASDIYSGDNYMHDSILFIDGIVLDLFLELLADLGLAKVIDDASIFSYMLGVTESPKQTRFNTADIAHVRRTVQVWTSRVHAELLKDIKVGAEILVSDKIALVGDVEFNINLKKTDSGLDNQVLSVVEIETLLNRDGEVVETGLILRVA